jgi:peptidyl-prolyl cis-trans isomerase D
MLQSIRGKLGSLPVMILLALLIVGFAIWGIGDVFRGGGVPAVATVGKEEITEQQFTTEFNRLLKAEQEKNPTLTAADAVKGGLDRQVLAFLIQQESVKQAMAGFGITATAGQIGKTIQDLPAFQMAGKFSEQQYEAILSQNGLTRPQFQEMMRLDLARAQMLAGATLGLRVPDKLGATFAQLMLEQRIGTMVLVPPSAGGAVPAPTPEQLTAFYQGRLKAYEVPEARTFRYGTLSVGDLTQKVSVSKTEIDQYIADHADEFGAAETRSVQQVVVQDAAQAKQIADRVGKGESFAAVAKAIFAAKPGGVTAPVQSDFGWHVFRVASVKAAVAMPEAQARASAEAKLRTAKAGDALYDVTGKMEDDLAAGQPLDDIAREQGIRLIVAGPIAKNGRKADGAPWSSSADAAKIAEEAFKLTPDSDPAVVELARDRFLIIQTTAIAPAAPRPLDQIRDRVAADYRLIEQRNRAEALAKQLSTGGGDLVALAKARNLPVQAGMSLSRAQVMASGQQVPPAIGLFFTQSKGKRSYSPTQDGGFAIVQVDDVRTPPLDRNNPLAGQIRQSLDQSAAEEVGQALQQALQTQLGTKIDEARMKQVRARLLGVEP